MKLTYKYQNFHDILTSNANKYGNKTAIFTETSKITHRQLLQKVDTFARFLELSGISYQDKVAIVLNNTQYFIVALFAITKIGAIAVPINNFLKDKELSYILNNSQAKLLITSTLFQKELSEVFDTTAITKIIWTDDYKNLDERNYCFHEVLSTTPVHEKLSHIPMLEDTAIIIYTSGTTGNPKGAMLSYKNILSNSISGSIRFDIVQKDRFIVYLPMFHSFTLSIMIILPLYNACSLVIVKSIFPFSNVLKQTLLKRVTIFLGAPQIYNALNKAKIPWYFRYFHCIRGFISGSAPLSEKVLVDFKQKFPKTVMIEGYGLSECAPAVCINTLDKQKPLSVGPAMPSYKVKIVDDELLEVQQNEIGEIIVQGDCVMQGYHNNPEATNNTIVNGWLRTGDLGKIDEDGYVYIVDRIKDLIISKGINVYPREIEELIHKIEGIDAVAVVGVTDDSKDEKIIAFVQLKEDIQDKPTVQSIKTYLKTHLASFKIPKSIYFIDQLPRNATNKVLKRKLKENIENYISTVDNKFRENLI